MASTAATSEEKTPSDLIGDDAFLAPFLEDDCDGEMVAVSLMNGKAISGTLERLCAGIDKIDVELKSQVALHDDDLLRQAEGIESLERALETVSSRVRTLETSVKHLRQSVVVPYEKVSTSTHQLARLQTACDLLRRVREVLQLCRRLESAGTRELSKASQALGELELVLRDPALEGIAVVDKERPWVVSVRERVESDAMKTLEHGMDTQNQSEVATGLQVFQNLGKMVEVVLTMVERLDRGVRTAIETTVRGGGGGSSGDGTTTPAWRAGLWIRMEKLMDTLYASVVRSYYLERVLSRRRDPTTPTRSFLDQLPHDQQSLVRHAWKGVTSVLQRELTALAESSASSSSAVRLAFDSEYTKLLRVCTSLLTRVRQHVGEPTATTNAATTATTMWDVTWADEQLRLALRVFERSFLTKSLRRMFEPIGIAFPEHARSAPTNADVDTICLTLMGDLRAVADDPLLSGLVAHNVHKALRLFAQRAEQLVATDRDATAVSGPCTGSQSRNIALANALAHLCTVIRGHESTSAAVRDVIVTGLDEAQTQVEAIVSPLLTAIDEHTRSLLASMHSGELSREDGTTTTNDSDATSASSAEASRERPASKYMNELRVFLAHAHSELLVRFRVDSILSSWARRLSVFLMRACCAHAVMVRPLGRDGRLQLAADLSALESTCAPLLSLARVRSLKQLDATAFAHIRAIKALLFTDNDSVVAWLEQYEGTAKEQPQGISSLRLLACLHLFSRGPSSMQAPHQRAQRSPAELVVWLQEHTQTESLALAKAAIDAYVRDADAAGATEYAEVYPLLKQLLV